MNYIQHKNCTIINTTMKSDDDDRILVDSEGGDDCGNICDASVVILKDKTSKIILSPRSDSHKLINKEQDNNNELITNLPLPQITITTTTINSHNLVSSPTTTNNISNNNNTNLVPSTSTQQVRVIKDGRFYEEPQVTSPACHYPVSNRQVNVISTGNGAAVNGSGVDHENGTVFRLPVVSSTSTPMRPPPPPPPKLKNVIPSEEPSSSIPDLEFDGTTVLCRVCGDKASGFHYGVHSCEGCKGFFRRSIQQKIQYRPCTKNQQCCILRINRNRCQYCRLKKCIAVGMSRDAVRFGRVPKREKARILAAMQQSTQNRGQHRATELDDQPRLLSAVLRAHMETCEFTRDKVTTMRQKARDCPTYSMPTLACPLNPAPELQSEQEFSQRFAHVIRGVIDFASMIPGFQLLTQDDKFTLLKAGLFDALFVRLICMFDSEISSIICLNGQVMRRDTIQNGANARFLVDSTFNFAERMNSMNLTDAEIGLFCAIVLITPDRPGLRNIELIEKMYSRLKSCLQNVILQNRPDQPEFMSELMKTLPDLRTLSTLHTEKLVVFRTEHKELLRQQMWSLDDDATSKSPNLHHHTTTSSSSWGNVCDNSMEDIAKSPMGSVSSTESGDTISSDFSHSLTSTAPLLAASLSGIGCPLRHRANSGSSAEDDIGHLTQNGLTITPVVRQMPPQHQHHIRYRKLDSPTDSGIESGNEKADHHKQASSSSGSSSCSSPRSSVEDATEEKKFHVEDMPVLKRVLQAPPLYDTNSLMDEAYKPHKKFRAMRHRESEAEAEPAVIVTTQQQQQQQQQHQQQLQQNTTITVHPPPQHHQHSQLHMHLTRPQNNHQQQQHQQQHQQQQQQSSLSSTHSVLAKSLMEEPRMTPEQMKRSDIIQNYIMRESQAESVFNNNNSNNNIIKSSSTSSTQQGLLTVSGGRCWPNSIGGGQSVITTTRHQSPSPSVNETHYFQSPHSTSSSASPPGPSSSTNSSTTSILLTSLSSSSTSSSSSSSSSLSAATSPRLLELQVDIADTQQPLNLSKKSPSPPPPTNRVVHKVLLEA